MCPQVTALVSPLLLKFLRMMFMIIAVMMLGKVIVMTSDLDLLLGLVTPQIGHRNRLKTTILTDLILTGRIYNDLTIL